MKLDVVKEREYLSTAAKKVWDDRCAIIMEIAKKEKYSEEQLNTVLQLQMAELRYTDLYNQNLYHQRTYEKNSQAQIRKNKVKMIEMQEVYSDQAEKLGSLDYEKLNQIVAEEMTIKQAKEREQQNTRKSKKTQ